MEESQLYANCIALALDLVKLYTIITGQEELTLEFEAVDMVHNVASQRQIFSVLCDQIVTFHSHDVLQFDVLELMNRLMLSAMDVPLEALDRVNQALKTHCLIFLFLNNFLVQNDRQMETFGLWILDQNRRNILNPGALQDLAPKKIVSNVEPTLQLSILSEPDMSHVIYTNQNQTVFNETIQAFTSVYVLTRDQFQVLLDKIKGKTPLTPVEKASLLLCVERLEQVFYWKQRL